MSLDRRARTAGWFGIAFVMVVFLVIGANGDRGPATSAERVDAIAKTVACPVCNGESIYESRAEIAGAMRDETAVLLEQGRTPDEIRAYWASRYGDEVLLTPPSTGIGALVWVVPVVAFVAAVAGLSVAFRRWQVRTDVTVTDEDRALVEEALRRERAGR